MVKSRRSQVNQIFVYLLSIIMIVFIGFLVGKFILGFTSEVKSNVDVKIYNQLKADFHDVYTTYGSEEVKKYRVSENIEYVCFAQKNCDTNSLKMLENISGAKQSLNTSILGGNNVALFDKNGIINSQNIGQFYVRNSCLCIKPKNNVLNIIFSNVKNNVWIRENLIR